MRAGWSFASLVVAALGASVARAQPPEVLPADDVRDAPHGYHRESRSSVGLVIAGASVFADAYLAAQVAGNLIAIPFESENLPGVHPYVMMLPVFGPFVYGFNQTSGGLGFFVVDGSVQLLGLAMLAAGLSWRHEVFRRNTASFRVVPRANGAALEMVW